MKRVVFLFGLLVMFSMNACSGNPSVSGTSAVTKKTAIEETSQGKVVHLDQAVFRELVWDYKKNSSAWVFEGDMPVIVDFYADWCRPCRSLAPTMDELAMEYKGKIRIYKVNTDDNKELSGLMGISSIPALLFVPQGTKPNFSLGALPKDRLKSMIDEILLKQKKNNTKQN
ncbi:MAG: thioredoxin [Bacteroidetes bacterium]|nr:thioredoxin [Bacteroidota bacterium]